MKTAITPRALLSLAAVALPVAVATADDLVPPPAAPTADVAPAVRVAAPCRVETIPARGQWIERQIAHAPVTAERQVPVTETVAVPVYAPATVPEVRTVEVPRYERRSEPVRLRLPNPFGCDDLDIKLWDRCKCVQTGTELRQEVVNRVETVKAGEVAERRVVGWRTETVVVAPARVETVREWVVTTPERRVTVGPVGSRPLPGTTEVLTDDQFRAAIALR
jgi:hypothetical protein